MTTDMMIARARAFWLQYYGLKTGPDGKFSQLENVAYLAAEKPRLDKIPESPGIMIAT